MKCGALWLLLLLQFSLWSIVPAQALTAVNDQASTQLNTPVVIQVLTNDVVVATNQTSILRVTQPSHGSVAINAGTVTNATIAHLFAFAAVQMSNTVVQMGNTNTYPWTTATSNGTWTTESVGDVDWVTGFFPGAMWLIYQYNGDTNFRNWAEEWMAGIASEQYSTNTDDVGFMINTSYGNAYRITGNAAYKAVEIQAAESFTNRFNHNVGCLADDTFLSPPQFQVIIDTMMNTEVLYNAHDWGGSSNLYNDAISHAGHTMTNQIRSDGSTYQEVLYNYSTGAVTFVGNRVSIPNLDTWARGHSWAIHAFTMVYQQSGNPIFLNAAERTATYYINAVPSDYVPYWYFTTNGSLPSPALRDSSAGCVTLSGMVQLSQLETNSTNAGSFWQEAINIFDSLSSTNYLAEGATTNSGIILHGDSIDTQTDCCLIYGDYYFIEALTRLNQLYGQRTVTYTPATNFSGTDTFTYQACDSSGNTSTATVSVTVGAPTPAVSISTGGSPVISFPTSSQNSYFVQYATNLQPSVNWLTLATNITGSGGVYSVTNTNAVGQRYYRVGVN